MGIFYWTVRPAMASPSLSPPMDPSSPSQAPYGDELLGVPETKVFFASFSPDPKKRKFGTVKGPVVSRKPQYGARKRMEQQSHEDGEPLSPEVQGGAAASNANIPMDVEAPPQVKHRFSAMEHDEVIAIIIMCTAFKASIHKYKESCLLVSGDLNESFTKYMAIFIGMLSRSIPGSIMTIVEEYGVRVFDALIRPDKYSKFETERAQWERAAAGYMPRNNDLNYVPYIAEFKGQVKLFTNGWAKIGEDHPVFIQLVEEPVVIFLAAQELEALADPNEPTALCRTKGHHSVKVDH